MYACTLKTQSYNTNLISADFVATLLFYSAHTAGSMIKKWVEYLDLKNNALPFLSHNTILVYDRNLSDFFSFVCVLIYDCIDLYI